MYSELQSESDTAKQRLQNMIIELGGKSATEIFEILMCDEILEYIVHETVTYAKNYKNVLNFNLTVDELKVFYRHSYFFLVSLPASKQIVLV